MPFADPERRREHAKEAYDLRLALLQEIKLERGCADCGYNEYACVLDFDHRLGEEKLYTPAHMPKYKLSIERMMAEIAKCDVVCANCHRIRTMKRKDANCV